MKLTKKSLLMIVKEKILRDESFTDALEITRKNSFGKIWLIGGALYKTLVQGLYRTGKTTKDFDLIVEKARKQLVLPAGWQRNKNRFGNPKFFNGELEIDFIPLEEIYYIKKNKLEPRIENFLAGVPLNIHFLVYDILDDRIFGDVGIKALEEKVVRVYNLKMANYCARKYNKTVDTMVKEKARDLGFKADLINFNPA